MRMKSCGRNSENNKIPLKGLCCCGNETAAPKFKINTIKGKNTQMTSELMTAVRDGDAHRDEKYPKPMKRIKERCLSLVPDRNWDLNVSVTAEDGKHRNITLVLDPVTPVRVEREAHAALPVFSGDNWNASGVTLSMLRAADCSQKCQLIPESVAVVKSNGVVLEKFKDYDIEPQWAKLGRMENGRVKADDLVYVSYSYYPIRLDSIVLAPDGKIFQKIGDADFAVPKPPILNDGEQRVGNIYFYAQQTRLTEEMIYPALEDGFPREGLLETAEQLLPRTWKKLCGGEKVKYLAWGDSVTVASYMPQEQRWPDQFAGFLRKHFPGSEIEYCNLGWGGHTSNNFMTEPSGSKYNYEEQILKSNADFITLEFVNDAYLEDQNSFDKCYNRILDDLKKHNIELLLIAPHYIRPDWMNAPSQKNIDTDPRNYVHFLRGFAKKNHLALADVSKRFGHLWREGIPYNIYMANNINHPDERGFKIFTDELTQFFMLR